MLNLRPYWLPYTLMLCITIALMLPPGAPSTTNLASAGALAANSPSAQPGDWPMYGHDPQRTFYNPDERYISNANVAQLSAAWQAHIGIGQFNQTAFSAPSVADGKVYIGSPVSTGDNLFALDALVGSRVWSTSIGHNPTECFGVGLGSTAAISGTIMVIGGGDSAYYGVNTDNGAQLWRDPLNVGPSGFAWVSPLLANGRAYVGVASDCDNPSVRGEVRALNYATGAHMGSAYIVPEGLAGGGIWNSPALSRDGSKLAVVSGEDYEGYNGPYNRAMLVLNSQSLDILAANRQGTAGMDLDWATTPMIFHDSAGRDLVGAGHKNSRFYVYDLNNVNAGPIWSRFPGLDYGTPGGYDPTFGNGGTIFYNGVQEHRLYALNPADGTERWPSVYINHARAGIAIANGLVFINGGGALMIINETNGAILRTITPPNSGTANTGPVVSNGTVYWISGEYLNAWRVPGTLATATVTSTPTSTPTLTPTSTATLQPPPCPGQYFTDVCPGDYFFAAVLALNADGILSGYNTTPPCDNSLWIPCVKPYNRATRGQITKIASLAAGFVQPVSGQLFEDVPPGAIFYTYTQRLAQAGIVSGYPCGGPGEPCGLDNRPWFRSNNNVTRAQLAKITSRSFGWNDTISGQAFEDVVAGSTFYSDIGRLYRRGLVNGYPCGGAGEPCGFKGLPYFRPGNDITRGQTAKIVHLARILPTATPTGTPTITPTTTPTFTSTPTSTNTATSTATSTESATETVTATPTATP